MEACLECHSIIKSLSGWAKGSFVKLVSEVLVSYKLYFYCLLRISLTKSTVANVTIACRIFWDLLVRWFWKCFEWKKPYYWRYNSDVFWTSWLKTEKGSRLSFLGWNPKLKPKWRHLSGTTRDSTSRCFLITAIQQLKQVNILNGWKGVNTAPLNIC